MPPLSATSGVRLKMMEPELGTQRVLWMCSMCVVPGTRPVTMVSTVKEPALSWVTLTVPLTPLAPIGFSAKVLFGGVGLGEGDGVGIGDGLGLGAAADPPPQAAMRTSARPRASRSKGT